MDTQVVVAGAVGLPPRVTLIVVESPATEPQVPPTEVTFAFVENGKVTVEPLTLVSVTTGAVVSIVIDLAPEVPLLPTASA